MSHQSLVSYMSSLQLFPLMCHVDRISKAAKKSDAGKLREGKIWQRELPDVSELSLLALVCCPTSKFNSSAQSKTGCCKRAEIKRGNWLPALWRHLRSTHRHLEIHSNLILLHPFRRTAGGIPTVI